MMDKGDIKDIMDIRDDLEENIMDLRADEDKHQSPEERLCMATCIAKLNEERDRMFYRPDQTSWKN